MANPDVTAERTNPSQISFFLPSPPRRRTSVHLRLMPLHPRCIKIISVHVLFLKPRASAERPRRAQKLIDSRDHETHTHTGTYARRLFFSPRTLFPEMASSPRKLLTQQTLLLRPGASPLPAPAEKREKVSAVADDLISMGAPLRL